MDNVFISRVQPEVQRLLESKPNRRFPVILTASDAPATAKKLIDALGDDAEEANPICLTGYIFASLKKSEVDIVLSFPEIRCVSLNRKAEPA